jgi:hypothetical protein
MLSRTPLGFAKVASGISLSAKPSQFTRYGVRLNHQVQMRQRSAWGIVPSSRLEISLNARIGVFNSQQRGVVRLFSSSRAVLDGSAKSFSTSKKKSQESLSTNPDDVDVQFKKTEKAEAAKAVDLSARLKERNAGTETGEVFRLLRLAAREWKQLGGTQTPSPSF